jgi:hypothetical protein
MKTLTLCIALAAAVSTPAFAGQKAGKNKGKGERPALVIKKFDKNGNDQIDADEAAALKESFAKADAESPLKKRLDQNGNGQLDDNELAKLNQRLSKRGEKTEKKGKKKAV